MKKAELSLYVCMYFAGAVNLLGRIWTPIQKKTLPLQKIRKKFRNSGK